jgi:tetratricopeptide (TPR) repeat protein
MIEAYSADPNESVRVQKGRHDLAVEAFGLVGQAKAAAADGDLAVARSAFRTAREHAPGEALIALAFGEFLLGEAAFDEARVEFKAAARLGAARYGAYYQLAKALRGLGRLEDAFEACQVALKYEPTRTGLLFLCADVLGRLGRYEQAVGFAEQCVRLQPENDRFRDLMGRLRARLETRKPAVLETARRLGRQLSSRRSARSAAKPLR